MQGLAHTPAHHHQLLLCGPPAETLPHVDGEQGAAAVEDGGEGAHEGRHDHRDHQAPQTWEEMRCVMVDTLCQLEKLRRVFIL